MIGFKDEDADGVVWRIMSEDGRTQRAYVAGWHLLVRPEEGGGTYRGVMDMRVAVRGLGSLAEVRRALTAEALKNAKEIANA